MTEFVLVYLSVGTASFRIPGGKEDVHFREAESHLHRIRPNAQASPAVSIAADLGVRHQLVLGQSDAGIMHAPALQAHVPLGLDLFRAQVVEILGLNCGALEQDDRRAVEPGVALARGKYGIHQKGTEAQY